MPVPAGRWSYATDSYELPLRLRPDAQDAEIIFGDLGYARHALASFGLFEAMQDAGKTPESWKFQVNLPSPTDVMSMIEPASRARVEPLYERAMLKQLGFKFRTRYRTISFVLPGMSCAAYFFGKRRRISTFPVGLQTR